MARVTDPTHLAALRSLEQVTRGTVGDNWADEGSPEAQWSEWLIYADYLDETPDHPIKGTGTQFSPNKVSTRGELAARIRAAVGADRERAKERGPDPDNLNLWLRINPDDPDDYQIGNSLDPDHNNWHPEGDPDA